MRIFKLLAIPAGVGVAAAWASLAFRDSATTDGLNDGLAVLITLNAVASGLTYALIGKAVMLKGRTSEGGSFGLAVSVMVICSIGGALLGIVHIVWSPSWVWFLPIAAGLLVGAPTLIPVLAIQEHRSRVAEVGALLKESVDQDTNEDVVVRSDGSIPDSPGLLRVRPKEFIADPSNPFKNDVLGREAQVKPFCSILAGIETPGVLSVDAPWGTGKTAFMKMCSAWIRSADFASRDVAIAEFNAWKQSHTGSALKDIVAAVTSQIPEVNDAQQRVAALLRREATKVASGGLIPDEVFEIGEVSNAHIDRFRKSLGIFAEASGRLIIFVDELDRCRPDYAMQVLECLRHLFDARGVLVVLTVNQEALNQAVGSLRGLEGERYLRRFVDQTIWLPPPDKTSIKRFVQFQWNQTGLRDRVKETNYTNHMFETLLSRPDTSLRDLEQAAHRVAMVFASIPYGTDKTDWGDPWWAWEQAAMTLMILRETDKDLYQGFADGSVEVFDVAEALHDEPPTTDTTILERMELALLVATRNGVSSIQNDDTRVKYHEDKRGEHYDKLRTRYQETTLLTSQLPDIDFLFEAIELVNSAAEGRFPNP